MKQERREDEHSIDFDNPYLDEEFRKVILRKRSLYEAMVKPFLGRLLALIGLILLSPLFLIICLAVVIDDPGPIFFRQKRVGQNARFFYLHKFRTMKMSTPHDMPTHLLTNPEQYITRVGGFLRKTSLDELPQLCDIVRGKMSIVSPRPALWNQNDLIEERKKNGAADIAVGLTGWAQVCGRDTLLIEEKAKLDGEYAKILKKGGIKAFAFDVKIIGMTALSVLKHEGVVEGGTGAMGEKGKQSILVVCQYYYPEPFRIHDICETLAADGHEVMVLTGEPNYPAGERYEGYEHGQHTDEVVNGVRVRRCYTIPRKTGTLHRFLNYYSYPISAKRFIRSGNCLTKEGKPFDKVFCYQLSPVMMAEPAILYKKKYKVPMYMYALDLWPESLTLGGIHEQSFVYKIFYKISQRLYKAANRIMVPSMEFIPPMRDGIGIDQDKLFFLPQSADALFEKLPYKESDTYDFMFAGNIGTACSIVTAIDAARILSKQRNDVNIHIVGDGVELENAKARAEGMTNVIFHGRHPASEMPRLYSMADAMLHTTGTNKLSDMTLSGKVQSYMAVGKPIVAAVGGEAQRVIKEAQCGFCGKAEDPEELAQNIMNFIQCKDRKVLGDNAYRYYQEHYSKDVFMRQLKEVLDMNHAEEK